jgi:hypothetical protein
MVSKAALSTSRLFAYHLDIEQFSYNPISSFCTSYLDGKSKYERMNRLQAMLKFCNATLGLACVVIW